ncbi:SMP-30/gluconolactonase/LRE family protein [Arthrobacter glacialis]|uniref:SMP-30/gluconolactonase/LRE family protein n=1 Tax=Arthrobacter glacialis TaxID=1664 RepID=UPI000CD41BDA|nr:SMP-30/gluconolactonase/LRE family protein [Arthrobacter glacialis]POH60138.1 calcium-binding protein [Arthrobacter glacialis]
MKQQVGQTLDVEALSTPAAGLGEGPVWDAATQTLLWVDIPGGLLHRTNPDTGATTTVEVGPYPAFIYPAGPGRVLISHTWDLSLVEEDTGQKTVLMSLPGDENTRLNDAKIDGEGRVVIGAMVYPWKQGGPCNVYRVDLSAGSWEVLASGMALSNGLDWNAAGTLAYFVDTPTRRIDVFDVAADGAWSGQRPFITLEDGAGNPDGMTLDAAGNIWVALFDGGAVRQYSPSGDILAHIQLPVPHITSLCFGGPELADIFVTTASNRLTDANRHLFPDAGKVFRIRGAGVGHAVPAVNLPAVHAPVTAQAPRMITGAP